MSIISFTNIKGGVGKSSTAIHFIYWLRAIKKKSVVVIDADSQGSTSAWLDALNLDIDIYAITDSDEIAEEVPNLKKDFDFVVIDNAGTDKEGVRATLLVADAVVIPITPSPLDLMASLSTVKIARQTQTARGGMPRVGMFVNNATRRAQLTSESVNVIRQIEGVTPLKQIIYAKQVIAKSFLYKATVWDVAGGREVAEDYGKLFNEILRMTK